MKSTHLVFSSIVTASILLNLQIAEGQNQPPSYSVQSWVDSETVAVVRVQAHRFSFENIARELTTLAPGARPEIQRIRDEWAPVIDSLQATATKELFAIVSGSDSFATMPFLVVPSASSLNVGPISSCIPIRNLPLYRWESVNGDQILAGSATFQRFSTLGEKPDFDFDRAFQELGGADVAAVLRLNRDHRRALAEWNPPTPYYLGVANWNSVLQDIDSIRIAFDAPPRLKLRLNFDAKDNESAGRLQRTLSVVIASIANSHEFSNWFTSAPSLKEQMQLSVDGSTVRLMMDANDPKIRSSVMLLLSLQGSPINRFLIEGSKKETFRRIRAIGLGILNYESAFKRLPTVRPQQEIVGARLSWRVRMMPYTRDPEAAAIYNEFHLDEPWDSEHNKKLIPRMPEIFRSPRSKLAASDGRSQFVIPSSATTMWPMEEGAAPRNVTDQRMHTVMLVEVDDDHAQIWTQPEPFVVDASDPGRGLGGQFEGLVALLTADLRHHFIRSDISDAVWNALFSCAGNEDITFDWVE